MAVDRGLPSVPRGLPREMASYLQSLDVYVRRLAGGVRGSDDSRALRASEALRIAPAVAPIGQNSIAADMLRDGSVTEKKIANGVITAAKLAQGAVTGKALAAGAVDALALAQGSVEADKIAHGVLLCCVSGHAADGETITVPGRWLEAPVIALTRIVLSEVEEAVAAIGPHDIRNKQGEDEAVWMFTAFGSFEWIALGKQEEA